MPVHRRDGYPRPPEVHRPEGSPTLFLAFRGTRDARFRTVRALGIPPLGSRAPQAAQVWRLLGERLTDEEKALQ
jgi:hypothetical protein